MVSTNWKRDCGPEKKYFLILLQSNFAIAVLWVVLAAMWTQNKSLQCTAESMVHLEVVAAAVTTSSPQGKSSEDILCFYAPVLRTDLKEHEGEIKVIPFPPWSVVKLKKQYNVGRTSAEVKVELKHYKTMNSLNDSNLCLQLDLRVTLSKLSDQPRFCEEIQAVGKYPQDLRDTQNAIAAMQKVSTMFVASCTYGSRANPMVKMTPRTTAI